MLREEQCVCVSFCWGVDRSMCQGGYKIPRRTKGVIRSSQGHRPSLFLLNKIHQDSVSLREYITFAKITGEREISLQTVMLAFKAIWEEVQTLTTDGISNDGLFRSLSHPFTYQSFCTSLCSLSDSTQWLDTVKLLDSYGYFHWSALQNEEICLCLYLKNLLFSTNIVLSLLYYVNLLDFTSFIVGLGNKTMTIIIEI